MSERHLGTVAAELADGHLDGAARERALVHLAMCSACRAEVEEHRTVRRRLAAMTPPTLPQEVTARLLALAPADQPLSRRGPAFGHPPAQAPTAPAVERPAVHAFAATAPRSGAAAHARHGRRRLVAAGMLAAAALGGGATLGARSGGAPVGSSGPVVVPGDAELIRYGELSRSVVGDDPAPVLAVVLHR